ncbi:MAG: metallophosphoesterase [Acidobacteriota bacterium]|nr:metallophosphoesterase [Acidobacteriota bacterium]
MKQLMMIALFLVGVTLQAEEPRLVAIGDVHGHYDSLVALLRETKLVDAENRWIGKDSILVQTGDLLDRGRDIRKVMDLMMRLEREAPESGGRVVVLLGNHEAMNIIGLTRDVNPAVYADFVTEDSEARRKEAYRAVVQSFRRRAQMLSLRWQPTAEFKDNWFKKYPPGYIEYMEAMGPEGIYGRWLREKDVITMVNRTLFMHAGIPPTLTSLSLDQINRKVREDIERADEWHRLLTEKKVVMPFHTGSAKLSSANNFLDDERKYAARTGHSPSRKRKALIDQVQGFVDFRYGLLVGEEGPLWFRQFAYWEEDEGAAYLSEILKHHGAERFVVGHTPQAAGISKRFGDQLFLIDTGMSSNFYKGGRASALEFKSGNCTAVYLDSRKPICRNDGAMATLIPDNPIGPYFAAPEDEEKKPEFPLGKRVLLARDKVSPLPIQDDDAVTEFLKTANILEAKKFGEGSTNPLRMVLEKDGVRMRAIFRDVNISKRGLQRHQGELRRGFHDRAIHEKAAYELARLLGLDRVPPVVMREYKHQKGTLQLWVEGAMNERDRLKENIPHPNSRFHNDQRRMMMVFDALIFNFDRNQGNILYGPDWFLWYIDHTRSFREESYLPNKAAEVLFCERNLWEKMKQVTDEQIESAVKEYLSPRQVKALLARRKLLVEHLEKLIEQRTEKIVIYDIKYPE